MTEAVHSSERGLFKEVEFSLTSGMDVRCASFHPIDPVLACGLGKGNLAFLRGSHHSTPFENWEIEPKQYRYGRIILSVQWNVNGTKVAAGSDDGTVSVWSYPGDGKQVFRRNGRSNFPLIVWNPFNPDVFASYNNALDTKQVMIANFANEKPLTHAIESYLNCQTVAWISYKQLACGYDDGTFEVHELGLSQIGLLNSEMVQKIRHDFGEDEHDRATSSHPDFQSELRCSVSSIAMNMELGLLASVGTDRRVKLWFRGTNDPTRIVKFPLQLNDLDSSSKSLVWCSDIKKRKKAFLACGLENGTIVIWYLGSNETLKLSGLDQIHQLLLSPDKRYLASIDYFKKVIIWCTESWEAIYILPSSGFKYPYVMTWDAASSKLGISGRRGQGQFNVIEYGVAEKCCAVCKKTSENLKRCGRCRSIYYCGRECQRSHWTQHKRVCHRHE